MGEHVSTRDAAGQQLRSALQECAERLGRTGRGARRLGEQNTKATLIDPILKALGWDLFDPDEVNREYRRRTHDNPVDYALLLSRTPRLFVEAKGLGENLDDPRWANQTISYAAVAGVDWVTLTDGSEWRLYNAHAPVPIEDKEFRRVRLADDLDAAYELLRLLSRDNMRDNRLRELWDSYHVDRETSRVLGELFADGHPSRELVTFVAKRVTGLPRSSVQASLQRVRATFDFPFPNLETVEPLPRQTPRPTQNEARREVLGVHQRPGGGSATGGVGPSRVTVTPRPKTPTVSANERRLRLGDLLESDRLNVGPVTATYDGRTWTAEIRSDGSISFDGTRFASLSAAGEAVKIAARGADVPASVRATDGWSFWKARDEVAADYVTLKEIRRRQAGEPSH